MTSVRPLVSKRYWTYVIRSSPKNFLAVFGALWLLIQIASFFSHDAETFLKGLSLPVVLVGLIWTLIQSWPRTSFSHRLSKRDIAISVKAGNIFDMPGAIVVGTNTSFDTSLQNNLISARSIQGVFTKKYYDNVSHLDSDLDARLEGTPFREAPPNKQGKRRLYPMGTCVKLEPRQRIAYWVAITDMNDFGVARGTFEDLKLSLPKLWEFIGSRGDCGELLMPVLGSGFARITEPKETIIREIINSFVAACSSIRFCECLTIVISEKAFFSDEIDLLELDHYVRHICKYTEHKSPSEHGVGSAFE